MPKISAANTSMTRVSPFENGRNEKIMSYNWIFLADGCLPARGESLSSELPTRSALIGHIRHTQNGLTSTETS